MLFCLSKIFQPYSCESKWVLFPPQQRARETKYSAVLSAYIANIEPSALRRKAATDRLVAKAHAHESWPLHHDISNPPLLRLTSRKPLWRESEPADINSQWREFWKSASVVNAHLVDDPTIRQPGFALPRQQWSLLNRFRTGQGHCGVCKKKWKLSDSDQCSCGETQTMSHIVESCPQDYTVACLNYTLQMMMPMPGWPVTAPNAYDNNNITLHYGQHAVRWTNDVEWHLLSQGRSFEYTCSCHWWSLCPIHTAYGTVRRCILHACTWI